MKLEVIAVLTFFKNSVVLIKPGKPALFVLPPGAPHPTAASKSGMQIRHCYSPVWNSPPSSVPFRSVCSPNQTPPAPRSQRRSPQTLQESLPAKHHQSVSRRGGGVVGGGGGVGGGGLMCWHSRHSQRLLLWSFTSLSEGAGRLSSSASVKQKKKTSSNRKKPPAGRVRWRKEKGGRRRDYFSLVLASLSWLSSSCPHFFLCFQQRDYLSWLGTAFYFLILFISVRAHHTPAAPSAQT